jgi:hypothetical protein
MKRPRAGIVAALVEVEHPAVRWFRDHSTPECGCGERAEAADASLTRAQPDPGGEAGSGTNFQK